MSFELSSLIYYPVKSLRAIKTESIVIDDFGVKNDRRFMLIDNNNQFITQREYPSLSLLGAALTESSLFISGADLGSLEFELCDLSGVQRVKVWDDYVDARIINNKLTALLSEYIGESIRLAYIPDQSYRQVDRRFFAADQRVSFADGFPVLLTNDASLSDLNDRLDEPISMSRFRSNIVFSGDVAFQEDDWKQVRIGEVAFKIVKPCSRCVMTTINSLGEKTKEPLKTLASYRRSEFGVCFGQNMVHLNQGVLSLGDKLTVI